jgi:hypothetical protein
LVLAGMKSSNIVLIMQFRLSPKVTLQHGDKIRVGAGPYYVSKSGSKIKMGCKGEGTFISAEEDRKAIMVQFKGQHSLEVVYIGPEYVSESTGTVMRPHKITKLRK